MEPNTPLKQKKKRLPRLKKIDIDLAHKKLLNTLAREIHHLFTLSVYEKLGKEDSLSLVNYVKLLNQLKKDSQQDLDSLTDEELEKIANK